MPLQQSSSSTAACEAAKQELVNGDMADTPI
jgi:hypothetical protein